MQSFEKCKVILVDGTAVPNFVLERDLLVSAFAEALHALLSVIYVQREIIIILRHHFFCMRVEAIRRGSPSGKDKKTQGRGG
jgi:hypothetical protein